MDRLAAIEARLRAQALAYPEAYEETPWGERVAKVNGKIFLFAGARDGSLAVTTKLPSSAAFALTFPFASPTGYGLGKSGWVTARFKAGEDVPEPLLAEWLEESYRAIAPKKLVKLLEQMPATAVAPKPAKAVGAPGKGKPAKKRGAPAGSARAPLTGKPRKPKGGAPGSAPALLVGDDPLRLERARAALEERGVGCAGLAAPDDDVIALVLERRPRVVVIDLGRRAPLGLELARALDAAELGDAAILFAGARDAVVKRKVTAAVPGALGCYRVPPGDAIVLERLAALGARARAAKAKRATARSRDRRH